MDAEGFFARPARRSVAGLPPRADKKSRAFFRPGESNREASRLGDVGSDGPIFQALRLKHEVKRNTRDRNKLIQSGLAALTILR